MDCAHLSDYKNKYGLDSYKIIFESFFFNHTISNANKKLVFSCFSCNDCVSRLSACLQCVYVGCSDHSGEHQNETGHSFLVDLTYGNIFCSLCGDYAYDKEVEDMHNEGCMEIKNALVQTKWKPTDSELSILRKHSKMIRIVHPTRGVRGIINFSNTCFMSCITQALIHTPALRDYFFAGKHECHAEDYNDCLVCAFSNFCKKYYKDETFTLYLNEIFYSICINAKHLAGSNQEDAHDFFMTVLNIMHQYSVPKNTSTEECSCIIDLLFHGKLQSDVVCQSCSNISTKLESINDIPLDIFESSNPVNLYDCLNHFTRTEPLNSKINCLSCNSDQAATKQLTFYTLPLVIVIQLKRFDINCLSKKSTFVSFPSELDMATYLHDHIKKNGSTETRVPPPVNGRSSTDHQYSLYAVVEHMGNLTKGHFMTYVRNSSDNWFLCNDENVNRVKIDEVLCCEGYMLFYYKNVLNYA